MTRFPVFPALAALLLAGCLAPVDEDAPAAGAPSPAAPAASPYAGMELRELKALSDQEVQDYLDGKGLGYALPAELNGYPGPLHVLELAEHLELDEAQRAEVQRLRAQAVEEAQRLGRAFLAVEGAIEEAFRNGSADDARLAELLEESGRVEAELRLAHLRTHVATFRLLTGEQVERYDLLRGYGGDAGAGGHEGDDHGAGHG